MIWVREFSTFEASLLTFWGFESDCKFLKMCNTFPTHCLSAHLLPQTSISQVQKPSLPFSLKPEAINSATTEVTIKDEMNHLGFFHLLFVSVQIQKQLVLTFISHNNKLQWLANFLKKEDPQVASNTLLLRSVLSNLHYSKTEQIKRFQSEFSF